MSSEDNVFAQLGLLGRSRKAVPQALTRRILELLTYLAKHQSRMAREMLSLRVPTPEEQLQLVERSSVWHIPSAGLLQAPSWHSCRTHDIPAIMSAGLYLVRTPRRNVCLS